MDSAPAFAGAFLMTNTLSLAIGQYSDKGRKPLNQDFHGALVPQDPLLSSKGIAVAIADGISSSDVSQIASQTAISSFFADYYSTAETWSVKTSAVRVLTATNAWLHAQTHRSQYRYEKDRGYVCTFSGMVFKSNKAHIFHSGDSRIYRISGNSLEQLTRDHRLQVAEGQSYLSRALGIHDHIDIDYSAEPLEIGDLFLLATDGVYDYLDTTQVTKVVEQFGNDLNQAAQAIVENAYASGSEDNLTCVLVRIDQLPVQELEEIHNKLTQLPFPPQWQPRDKFDGYQIVRQLYASARSHIYLAVDEESGETVAIKVPSTELRQDTAHLERFLLEEWIARRINSAYVLKPCRHDRARSYFYIATEFIEGTTLTQWMADNPQPDMSKVRDIVEQIAKGLRAFHKLEMLHQDLRPANIMIDNTGTVKIIDFGSALISGLSEIHSPIEQQHILGTAQYTAPEYFIGDYATPRSDQFSLAVIAYQMLSGRLPYGTAVSQAKTRTAQRRLIYQSVLADDREIPVWVDETLKKALHPNPYKRYDELTEFIYDLKYPNPKFVSMHRPPLVERNPTAFWQLVSLGLTLVIIYLLWRDV